MTRFRMPRVIRMRSQEGVDNQEIDADPHRVDHLTVDHATLSQIAGGATNALIFRAIDDHGNVLTRNISVVSGTPSKATVSPASGPSPLTVTVTPVAAGSSVITASSEGKTITSTDTVAPAVDHVTVDHATLSQTAGGATGTLIFTARDVSNNPLVRPITVVSADPTVATALPASGTSPLTVTVTPLLAGSSVITATSEGKTVISTDTVS